MSVVNSAPVSTLPSRTPTRPPWWLLFVPLLLLVLVPVGTFAQRTGSKAITALDKPDLPTLIDCVGAARPRMIVAAFDVSGSVIDRNGADPKGRSFDEFRYLIEQLSERPCHRDDRVAALIFSGSTVEVPPTLVSSASVAATTIRRPPANEIGGSTDMTEAFKRASEIVTRFDDYDIKFVVFSDNRADTPASARSALNALGAEVHLVALGEADGSFFADYDSVIDIDDVTRGAVATALVELVNADR